MRSIKRSYLIEVNLGTTVPGSGANLNFQDYPQLRDVYVTGISIADSNTATTSPSGKLVVGSTAGITLTAVDKFNMEILHQYPTKDLNPYYTSGFYRDLNPFPIQLTKSFLTILDNTGLAANGSVLINIYYLTPKEYAAISSRK
jgi:hypothetical protein